MADISSLICIDDYNSSAKQKLPKSASDFLNKGADDQLTLRRNIEAFRRIIIRPRMLRDVSKRDLSVSILNGQVEMPFPIGVAPVGLQKILHTEGEAATAKGVTSKDTVMIASTVSNTSMEDIAKAAGPEGKLIYQFYMYKDRKVGKSLLDRAYKSGYKAVVFTVDVPTAGNRRDDRRNTFSLPPHLQVANFAEHNATGDSMRSKTSGISGLKQYSDQLFDIGANWSDLEWMVKNSSLPVLIKGVLTPEDANLAYQHGAKGVIVSNHGGRQLDSTLSSIEALPEIAEVMNGKCEVFLDGGVRTGNDVFKALGLGAKAVFVGRPAMWGLTVNGSHGVGRVLELLREELDLTMALAGCRNLSEIDRTMLRYDNEYSKL